MAKNKANITPHYELLYILSNKYAENELKPIMENVAKVITSNQGNITYFEEWGKKKFCYPIKSFHYGYYNLIEFDCEALNLEKINKDFRMMNEILRFQIVSRKLRSAEEIKREKASAKAQAKKVLAEKEEKEKPLPEKKKGKVNLKELDEKLDKILDTDDLL